MENINQILANNIYQQRKACALTQEELAERLEVSFQAVSKWETAKSAPDITLLPLLADTFGCTLDALFSRESAASTASLPWEDDEVIRGAVFQGKRLLVKASEPLVDRFVFEVKGDALSVQSECSVAVSGNILGGGCNAGDSIAVGGSVTGGCNAGDGVSIGGSLTGACNCGDGLCIGGAASGSFNSGDSIRIQGNAEGSFTADEVFVAGDVHATDIRADEITCAALYSDGVKGEITIKEE